jgi:hypothetical protein
MDTSSGYSASKVNHVPGRTSLQERRGRILTRGTTAPILPAITRCFGPGTRVRKGSPPRRRASPSSASESRWGDWRGVRPRQRAEAIDAQEDRNAASIQELQRVQHRRSRVGRTRSLRCSWAGDIADVVGNPRIDCITLASRVPNADPSLEHGQHAADDGVVPVTVDGA